MDSLNHISDEINMHICFLRQLIELQCTRLVTAEAALKFFCLVHHGQCLNERIREYAEITE